MSERQSDSEDQRAQCGHWESEFIPSQRQRVWLKDRGGYAGGRSWGDEDGSPRCLKRLTIIGLEAFQDCQGKQDRYKKYCVCQVKKCCPFEC